MGSEYCLRAVEVCCGLITSSSIYEVKTDEGSDINNDDPHKLKTGSSPEVEFVFEHFSNSRFFTVNPHSRAVT